MSRFLLLLLSLFSYSCFAGLNKVSIQDLNLDYVSPRGTGDFVKFSLDLSLIPQSFPLEIENVEGRYVLRTPMADLTWSDPGEFLLGIEELKTRKVSADLGKNKHSLIGEEFSVKFKDGEYKLKGLKAECEGESEHASLDGRLLEDCREKLLLSTLRAETPGDFILLDILKDLPLPLPLDDMDETLEGFYLTSHKGDVFLYFLTRVVVKAGLRAWGKIDFEDNLGTAVIKVNLIRFGILPVTNVVMNELKKRIKNPNVVVNPPYIRIKLRHHESSTN